MTTRRHTRYGVTETPSIQPQPASTKKGNLMATRRHTRYGVTETPSIQPQPASTKKKVMRVVWIALVVLIVGAGWFTTSLINAVNQDNTGSRSIFEPSDRAPLSGTQQQAPQPASTQEPAAVPAFTPSQAAPLPAPAGLSDEELLDWRLVQRDKVYSVIGQYDAGTNTLITPATIYQDTATWVKIINTQTSILPASDTSFASTFKGHPWAADNVVLDITSDIYPKMVNGALVPASIVENTVTAVRADGTTTSGPVRFFTAMLRRPGMPDVKHTFAFYWHEASDKVGRPIIAVCRITTNLTPQTC